MFLNKDEGLPNEIDPENSVLAMYEAAFKNIDDTLRKDAGCSSELDYIEQTSWILFLKYLDDFEADKKTAALLNNKSYSPILDGEFRWAEWAAPKQSDGKLDYNSALTGDDLHNFVNNRLFPHLASFKQTAESPRSITYKIGEWIKGDYTLYNEFNSFEDWAKSNYEGIKIAEKNSKIIFESLDGKISQKKNLIESKDDSVQFIEGYSLTLIDSPLGKLLRFKMEGDIFKFGENEFIIKSIS